MKLAHYDQGKLTISKANMHYGKKAPDVSHILPSIRERGVIVPLIVRPVEGGDPDQGEIVAGARRWTANGIVLDEGVDHGPLPCAVMEPGDDASAIEASLLENFARRDPDEVTEWHTFTRLVKEGRTVEQIGQTFGMTNLQVRQVLALGNLLPRIRALYSQKAIDAPTIRHLTLASKARQKEWLALYDDPEQYAPTSSQLKAWLFGGQSIPTTMAIFDLAAYPGRITTDLFGEDGYFEDPDLFWTEQNRAVAALRDRYLEDGWNAVEVMDVGDYFHSYDHEKTPKDRGGRVYIAVTGRGEVTVHEGWLSGKEARRARADAARAAQTEEDRAAARAGRPETTSSLQAYIDLHRHAAVRAVMADHPGVALRLMVAHAVTSAGLWTVKVESQRARSEAVTESVETCAAETRFDARRREALALLKRSPDDPTVILGHYHDEEDAAAVFARLLALSDAEVMTIAAVVMGESLAAGGEAVEAVGAYLKPDMAELWTADDAFFDLIRDRAVANAMLKDVGGKRVADGNVTEKVKTQLGIIRDHLAGANDRPKVEGWTPKWLAFPPAAYVGRPFPTAASHKAVQPLLRRVPKPAVAAPAEPASAPDAPDFAIAA